MATNRILNFRKSIRHAMRGVVHAMRRERNFQIEIGIALLLVALMVAFRVTAKEAVILIVMIGWVLTMELLNTATERMIDILKPRVHPYAKVIKDLMAAAVLLSSLTAATVGAIILLPYILLAFGLLK